MPSVTVIRAAYQIIFKTFDLITQGQLAAWRSHFYWGIRGDNAIPENLVHRWPLKRGEHTQSSSLGVTLQHISSSVVTGFIHAAALRQMCDAMLLPH